MPRTFLYLIDGLTAERGQRLKQTLERVAELSGVAVQPSHGLLEVRAAKDPETQVRMACSLVGTTLRVRVKKRKL